MEEQTKVEKRWDLNDGFELINLTPEYLVCEIDIRAYERFEKALMINGLLN